MARNTEPPTGGERPENQPTRAVIHLDLDAFFASVEILENPELTGKPVIVGGSPSGRGVVTSASYSARRFGIRSAMPTARALALCPSAVVLPARHRLYSAYSRRVMDLLRASAPKVQQVSIDEAFLDLTGTIVSWAETISIARQLQSDVLEQVGLSASLGVASNKLVAKVASDRDKPGGLTVVQPGQEAAFLAPLPVRVLWGVGPVTARNLAAMQITTVGQLAEADEGTLRQHFGRHGAAMARHARGIDSRPVVARHHAKSTSQERTFSQDIAEGAELESRLLQLSQGVSKRLKKSGTSALTICLKLRYSDFTTLSRQMSLAVPTDEEQIIYQAARTLFHRCWQKGRPIRLLGVAARHLSPTSGQLPLW